MDVATRLVDSITERFSLLARFPYLGRARDEDFGAGRSFPLASMSLSIASRTRRS
jgi:hypothetical protein